MAPIWADTRTYNNWRFPGGAEPSVEEVLPKSRHLAGGLRVLSYRVMLDVPFQLVMFVSRLLAGHRREIGTRRGTRALTCWNQAVFV